MVSVGDVSVAVGVSVLLFEELLQPATAGIAAVPSATSRRRRVVNCSAVPGTARPSSVPSAMLQMRDSHSMVVNTIPVTNVAEVIIV
jgi:hypothetical protein